MAAIDFPASPSVNDTKTVGDTVWVWNGTYWARSANTAKFTAADAAPSSPTLGDLWYESDSGKAFIYYDNTWVELGHASDGQSFKVGDTIPAASVSNAGDIWFESDTGNTLVYYTDANTSQWVEIGQNVDSSHEFFINMDGGGPTSLYGGTPTLDGGGI